jgi:hypothetical protein
MISAKNYAAQAEAEIRRLASAQFDYKHKDYDLFCYETFSSLIKEAVHFAIPDNGEIFDDDLKGLVGLQARIPFPAITVEYFVDGSKSSHHESAPVYSPRRLALAIESDKNQIFASQEKLGIINGIDAFALFPDDNITHIMVANEIDGMWLLCPMSWVMPVTWNYWPSDKEVKTLSPLVPSKSKQTMAGTPIPILPGLFTRMCELKGVEQAFRESIHDISGEVRAVLELCEALTCSNVITETIQHENTKANAKRIKNGKIPIYETKTLSIEVPRSTKRSGIKRGDRSSPRQHLRRGHIRRLPDDRNIWVNSCAVGSPEFGRVDKSYRVFSA